MTLDDIPSLDTLQDTATAVIDDLNLPEHLGTVADVATVGAITGRAAGRRASRRVVLTVRQNPRWVVGALTAIAVGIVAYVLLSRKDDDSASYATVEDARAA